MKKFAIAISNFYDEGIEQFIVDDVNEYEALKKAMLSYRTQNINDHDGYQNEKDFQKSDRYPADIESLKTSLHNQGAYFIAINEIHIESNIINEKLELIRSILRDNNFNMSTDYIINLILPDTNTQEIKDKIKCLNDLDKINDLYKSF